jgi:hypothetical protein
LSGAKLGPGNVHSAGGWEEVLLPQIERQQKLAKEVAFRADAAFARPEVYGEKRKKVSGTFSRSRRLVSPSSVSAWWPIRAEEKVPDTFFP